MSADVGSDEDVPCGVCGAPVGPLEVFPPRPGSDGVQCLSCYAESPAGRAMPTAEQVATMWKEQL